MPFRESTVLDMPPLGMSYNGVGCEFSVDACNIY